MGVVLLLLDDSPFRDFDVFGLLPMLVADGVTLDFTMPNPSESHLIDFASTVSVYRGELNATNS